ncbi:MAG: hypothetical protein WBF79_13555 [Rhodococcus sp. (in: high G+C Gram-positive bacteria)]
MSIKSGRATSGDVLARVCRLSLRRRGYPAWQWVLSGAVIAVGFVAGVRWDMAGLLGVGAVSLAAFPQVVLFGYLTLPGPAGVMQPHHLHGLPVPVRTAWLAFVRGRLRLDATPRRVAVLGGYAGAAAGSVYPAALVVIALVVVGGPLGYVAAVTSVRRAVAGTLCLLGCTTVAALGIGNPVWAVAISATLMLGWSAASVLSMRKALDPLLPSGKSVSLRPTSLRLTSLRPTEFRLQRTPHLRAVLVDMQRRQRWIEFAPGWILTIGAAVLATGVDVILIIPIVAVYAVLGLAHGGDGGDDAVGWIVDVPGGVRRHLWARTVMCLVGTAPCWTVFASMVWVQDDGPSWCAVPILFGAAAVRAAVVSTYQTELTLSRMVVDMTSAALLFGLLQGTVGAVPNGVGVCLVAAAASTLLVVSALVSHSWRDGGDAWIRMAARAHR